MTEGLRGPLAELLGWLEQSGRPHVLIGGIAVGIIARPRTTLDIDGILWIEDATWVSVIADARARGFSTREADPIEFIRRTRMLLLRHDRSGVDVDLSLGALPFEREVIARRRMADIDGLAVPVPTAEDLVILKAIAHRPQDLADIQSILERNPNVDMAAVHAIVNEFAEVLEQPEILEDLKKLEQRILRGRASSP